jgi:hypothetical protein
MFLRYRPIQKKTASVELDLRQWRVLKAKDALILSDTVTVVNRTNTMHVETTISPAVTNILVEYAVFFSSTSLQLFLMQRCLVANDDYYLFVKGGELQGTYAGSVFDRTWDQAFYFLNFSGETGDHTIEALYAKDDTGDKKIIPVVYFPEEMREAVDSAQRQDFISSDNVCIRLGASYAYLTFSKFDGEIIQNLSLYTVRGNDFAEQPREAGGMLMPVVFVDGQIQGQRVERLLGGFQKTISNWSMDLDYNIFSTQASGLKDIIPNTDGVILNLCAYNEGSPNQNPDIRRYNVTGTTRGDSIARNETSNRLHKTSRKAG